MNNHLVVVTTLDPRNLIRARTDYPYITKQMQ